MKLLLGTRKGLVVYNEQNGAWNYENLYFKGIPVSIAYIDERDDTWWACLDHGHWGVKLHRSKNQGQSWEEVAAPKYPEGAEIKADVPATTRYIWAFAHAGLDRPGELYLGTEPGGLFKSTDGGDSWELIESLWNHSSRIEHWFGAGRDHAGLHSIFVDPNDSDHIFVGISVAGVFETTDGGATWHPKNKGLLAEYLPDPHVEVGHDPHILVGNAAQPNLLWQQNHCGIFRTTDSAASWQNVSGKDNPAYFGFALALDEANPDRAWVVPADSDEVRVAVDEALCVCRTDDGGKTWKTLRNGLPQENCFDIVYRHCLAYKNGWLIFGTTCGNLFVSNDLGESWEDINHYLPMVYSVVLS